MKRILDSNEDNKPNKKQKIEIISNHKLDTSSCEISQDHDVLMENTSENTLSLEQMMSNRAMANSTEDELSQMNELHIPLKFWFCQTPELAIPVCYLPYATNRKNIEIPIRF